MLFSFTFGCKLQQEGSALPDGGLSSTSYFALSPLESYLIFEFLVESSCPLLLLEENNLHQCVFITFCLSFGRTAAEAQAGEPVSKLWPGTSCRSILLPSLDANC